MTTEDVSFVRDILKPRVIVNKETVEMMNKALQFTANEVKQNEELVEVEEEQIDAIVPDYSASGNIAVDNN